MPLIDLNGFKMNYDIVPGVAPHDTLFVHGNTASNRWWIPTLKTLRTNAKTDLPGRAIFAEWRGCGQSAAPTEGGELHPSVLGADYVALLEKLGIESASVVGHSLGGLIALYAVAARPSMFKQILLLNSVGPKGIPYDDSAYDYFESIPASRASCARALSFSFHDQQIDSTLFDRLVDDTLKMSSVNWSSIWRMLGRFDGRDVISKIGVPALIIHGAHDRVLPLEDAHTLMATLPNAKLVILPDQGHSPNIENPEHFVSLLTSFLEESMPKDLPKESADESRDDRGYRAVRTGQSRPELVL